MGGQTRQNPKRKAPVGKNASGSVFSQVLPHLLQFLPMKDVLKCRKVCHDWKASVDILIAEMMVYVKQDDPMCKDKVDVLNKKLHSVVHGDHSYMIEFHCSGEIERFLHEMRGHLFENPFPGRSLYLSGLEFDTRYWQSAIKLLQRYGDQVWDIGFHVAGDDPTKFISIVKSCLLHLPNLKKIFLYGEEILGCGDVDKDQLSKIRRNLKRKSFPALPLLREVNFLDVPNCFYGFLPVSYWQQLETMSLHMAELANDDEMLRLVEDLGNKNGLRNLKELAFNYIGIANWPHSPKMKMLKCPLETLIIDNLGPRTDFGSVSDIFEHFGDTLKHAKVSWIHHPFITSRRMNTSLGFLDFYLRPSLPHLKTLELSSPLESLNWLQYLESLEFLQVGCSEQLSMNIFSKKRSDEKIEIHGFVDRMYQSNIWTVLSSLKEFKFRGISPDNGNGLIFHAYTRDGYIMSSKTV